MFLFRYFVRSPSLQYSITITCISGTTPYRVTLWGLSICSYIFTASCWKFSEDLLIVFIATCLSSSPSQVHFPFRPTSQQFLFNDPPWYCGDGRKFRRGHGSIQ
eukprot:TRINITY_DN4860_c0_g1_i1.p1 TRINITY_DN4860_c0_g1~~TRINITY_DN4860_c0_g1_i1.p1  ORF type:complete len:104 (-),score=4.11 TRINITY_DN4860_c0_g1_i1:12-323(-)